MRKVSKINKSDIESLEELDDNYYIVPDGVVIYVNETNNEKIATLQNEYDSLTMKEPSNDELIELGKSLHLYYEEQERKEAIEKEIEELSE